MFFVDKPYLSDFLKKTIRDHAIPIVDTVQSREMGLLPGTLLVSEAEAIERMQAPDAPPIYTTSENALGWIAAHLASGDLPEKVELFKDKAKFRRLLQPLFPDFYFKEIRIEDAAKLPVGDLPFPLIIKPAVGFMSLGVRRAFNPAEWVGAVDSIEQEIQRIKGLYPEHVVGTQSFIIEACMPGEEFAVDAYFDADGNPVVLGILQHLFSSEADLSDRVYVSSKEIMEQYLDEFTGFIGKLGRLAGVKNFAVHVELRRDAMGTLFPIEVNPMRFGGWCTTADLSFYAYGLNPYLCYYAQDKPDWPALLEGKEGKLFSLVVLENSTGISGDRIQAFDYEKVCSMLENPLELRKIDVNEYPVFGFLFAETRAGRERELENVLNLDLNEFVSMK